MHELSIAEALLERAVAHTPPGSVLRIVHLRAGPLRGIDEEAMGHAWLSVTAGTPYSGVELDLTQLPWRLRCLACFREFSADDLALSCACGSAETAPVGGDELQITSLTVDDLPAEKAVP